MNAKPARHVSARCVVRPSLEVDPEVGFRALAQGCRDGSTAAMKQLSRPILVACRDQAVFNAFRSRYGLSAREAYRVLVDEVDVFETPFDPSKMLILIPGWEMNPAVRDFVNWWDAGERFSFTLDDEPEAYIGKYSNWFPRLVRGWCVLLFVACCGALLCEFFTGQGFRVVVPWMVSCVVWILVFLMMPAIGGSSYEK